jgi:hypothetical protein
MVEVVALERGVFAADVAAATIAFVNLFANSEPISIARVVPIPEILDVPAPRAKNHRLTSFRVFLIAASVIGTALFRRSCIPSAGLCCTTILAACSQSIATSLVDSELRKRFLDSAL